MTTKGGADMSQRESSTRLGSVHDGEGEHEKP